MVGERLRGPGDDVVDRLVAPVETDVVQVVVEVDEVAMGLGAQQGGRTAQRLRAHQRPAGGRTPLWKTITLCWKMITLFWKMITFWKMISNITFVKTITLFSLENDHYFLWKMITIFFENDNTIFFGKRSLFSLENDNYFLWKMITIFSW